MGMTRGYESKVIEVPGLNGRWFVWSQSDFAPGAYFCVASDEAAQAQASELGLKWVTVTIIQRSSDPLPTITLRATNPPRPELLPKAEKKGKR